MPGDVDVRDASLVDLLDTSVERFGPSVALEFFVAETTFVELGQLVRAAAEGLRQLGVGAGDRVAIVLPNCPQHIVAFHAILRLGAVVVEHNPLYTASQMEHQLIDHGATVAVVWDKAAGLVTGAGAVTKVVSVDLTTAMPLRTRLALRLPVAKARTSRAALTEPAPGTIPWRRLLLHGNLASDHPRPTSTDLAAIQYTSGTTAGRRARC